MGTFHKFSVVAIQLLLLFGCGGGGGGNTTVPATSTGVFLDSPVINIGYRTETLKGVTNALGEYEYLPGETVIFFIGDLDFPAVTATDRVTPLDVAGTQDTANSKVINMIRLLQTLDQDGDPSNGITITDIAKSSATQVNFELSTADFAASSAVKNLILNAGLVAPVNELVSAVDALAHFKKELIKLGILPVEFKYLLYDDFSDPGSISNFTLWSTQGGATTASTLEIVGGSLIATAVKDAEVRADQGLWVANATNVSLTDFQAFSADFTILEATGNATNRAQILLGFPLETEDYFVDTGINFYASGEVKYFIEIFNNLGQPITEIVGGTIATVDPTVVHTLSIGWDGSNYIFQVDNIAPIVIPMSAATDISNANNWSWAAVRATVKDTGTGTTVAKIDNVQRGSTANKVLADNFDSGALATGVWKQSLDGVNRSIQGGRLVNTVTSSGPQVSVNTGFIGDHTYMETTVRISSDSVINVGARGKARLAGYFYNDRRGPGSGLLHNGYEGDVWAQVAVNLRDNGTLFARAFLGPDEADGQTTLATFLDQTFSTSVQFDTDYVMSIEQTADGRIILTFNGESFIYQETGPMYPISDLSYQGLTARIYAGGTGGTLLVEWDDVYVVKIDNVQMTECAGICSDASGDAAFAVIDLQDLKVTVDATEISVDIGLLDIPNPLTYNSTNLSDNYLEYEWRIAFDVDGNGHLSNDIILAISHFKPTGGVQMQDALLNFTQKSVWLVNSDGSGSWIGIATATQNLSTLTITVQKSVHASLATIVTSTPFKFRAFYRVANTNYKDSFPDDGGYAN